MPDHCIHAGCAKWHLSLVLLLSVALPACLGLTDRSGWVGFQALLVFATVTKVLQEHRSHLEAIEKCEKPTSFAGEGFSEATYQQQFNSSICFHLRPRTGSRSCGFLRRRSTPHECKRPQMSWKRML